MTEEQKLSVIHTSCKDCIFSIKEENKQIGCKMDRLKYHEVVEAYDDDAEFYVINESFCLYYRTKALMEYLDIPESLWESTTKSQVKVNLHVILLLNKDDKKEDLINALRALKSQIYPPTMVTVVNKQYVAYSENPDQYEKPSELYKCLIDSGFNKITFKNIYDSEISDREIIDLIYDNTSNLPLPLYMVFEVGYKIPLDFMKDLDDAIINKLMSINFAYPIDHINGMIVSKVAHQKYSGNAFNIPIEEKIKQAECNLDKIMFNIKDICPTIR